MAIIVLTGMDITTAILLIDQIMRRRREGGRTRDEAIALACRDRLRPILMTSLITIITMLPVAAAPKTGMDAYQPLGTVIVAGLLIGTLLSLLVIPVMHAVVDDLRAHLPTSSRPGRRSQSPPRADPKREHASSVTHPNLTPLPGREGLGVGSLEPKS
jgi:HAE1 family hydrophobic/amphiphilic exporter-1